MDFVRLDLNKEEYMQKIYTLIVLMAVVLLGGLHVTMNGKMSNMNIILLSVPH